MFPVLILFSKANIDFRGQFLRFHLIQVACTCSGSNFLWGEANGLKAVCVLLFSTSPVCAPDGTSVVSKLYFDGYTFFGDALLTDCVMFPGVRFYL